MLRSGQARVRGPRLSRLSIGGRARPRPGSGLSGEGGAYCGRRCADAQMVEVELGEALAALTAEGEPLPPDVYAQLGIEPFINCCGELSFTTPLHRPRLA